MTGRKIIIMALTAALIGTNTAALAERLYHSRTTTYTDGTAIPTAKIPTIQYRVYYGPTASGPWTLFDTHLDNVAATVPAAGMPNFGGTMFYTGDATLDGATSALAPGYAWTRPFPEPAPPAGLRVAP